MECKPGNDAEGYGVKVEEANVGPGEKYWQAFCVHHLTPEECRGKHNLFVDVLDEKGQRNREAKVRMTLQNGQTFINKTDKPEGEPGTNFPIWKGNICSVEALGLPSDKVVNIHTDHPDEPMADGSLGSTRFHHSFLVCFKPAIRGAVSAKSVIQGMVRGGKGFTIDLLTEGEVVASQVIGDDESYRFENVAPGSYSVAINNLQADGENTLAVDLDVGK
jgi:hypothetical protein